MHGVTVAFRVLCAWSDCCFQGCLKQMCYFTTKRTSLVNKGQNTLHMLSLDANSIAILHWQYRICAHKYIFIWRANFSRL